MKKNKLALLSITAALLLAGCAGSNEPTSSESSSSKPTTSETESQTESQQTSTPGSTDTTPEIDEEITLKMFGDLYPNGQRSVYALLKNNTDSDIVWSTSDEKVAIVSALQGAKHEGLITATGLGKVTITAALEDYPTIKKSIDIELKNGEVMPESLYNGLTGSLKVVSDIKLDNYNSKLVPNTISHEKSTTIYEEYFQSKFDPANFSDGYTLRSYNALNPEDVTVDTTFVRSQGTSTEVVSLEGRNMYNNRTFMPVKNSEDKSIRWNESPYRNLFNDAAVSTHDKFMTFDGGKTYHFIGGEDLATTLTTSLYALPLSVDDLYFEVLENNELKLHVDVDPFVESSGMEKRVAWSIESTFAEKGTAKVNHVPLFEHHDYHDVLKTAIDKLKDGKNYTVSYSIDFADPERDDPTFVYTFTETDVNEVKYYNGEKYSENGRHLALSKEETGAKDEFFIYRVEKDTNKIIKTNYFKNDWKKSYPDFYFANEIFTKKNETTFETIDQMGQFITRALILGMEFNDLGYAYDKGQITLDENGDIKTMTSKVLASEITDPITITATFSKIGTSSVDLDFSKAENEKAPETWAEYSPMLYRELKTANVLDAVPFMVSPTGYSEALGNELGGSKDDGHYKYISTGIFLKANPDKPGEEVHDLEAVDKFVADYKALLEANGYHKTGETTAIHKYELFTDAEGRYTIGVGREMSKKFTGIGFNKPAKYEPNGRARIVIISQLINWN